MMIKKSLIHTVEKPEHKIYIYGLCDPDTGFLRYIGLATTGFKRIYSHYTDCGRKSKSGTFSPSQNWIRNLKLNNKVFKPIYLEYFETDGEHVDEAEQFWISSFKMLGAELLNLCNGGRPDYAKTYLAANKQRLSNGAKKANGTPEKRKFFRNHTTETWKDPEIRARRIAGLQGPKSKEHVEKVKEAVTKTCGTHVEDDKGNFFPSLSECARFYNLDVGTIRRILYATTRKYAHIKLKRVGGAGKDPKDMHIDCSYIPVAQRVKDG